MSGREIKRTTSDKPIPAREKRRSLLDILSGKKDGKMGFSFSSADNELTIENLQGEIEEEVKKIEQEKPETEKIEKTDIISRCKKKKFFKTLKSKNLN
jgi:hypothetical protein